MGSRGFAATEPRSARTALPRAIHVLDAAARDACLCHAGSAAPLIAVGRYGIKRHVLVPGFALLWVLGRSQGRARLAAAGRAGVVGLTGTALVVSALKLAFRRERPGDCGDPGCWGGSLGCRSFPSGHAGSAFAAATAIAALGEDPALAGALYASAAILSATRMLCDRHWLSDVVVGGVIGAAVTAGAQAAMKPAPDGR